MTDDIFKTWTSAQKNLWTGLSSALPTLRPPTIIEGWRDIYANNLTAWESTIKQSLTVQASWLEQWAQSIANKCGDPENKPEWNRQVEEVMTYWIQTQTQLWEQWFDLLRSDNTQPSETDSTAPLQTAETEQETRAEKPAVAPEFPKDDLKAIAGIGPKLAEKLYQQGITSYQQLAKLTDDAIDQLDQAIMSVPGRIRHFDWVGQAKKLHSEKYG